MNFEGERLVCPAGKEARLELGEHSKFKPKDCESCALREKCTKSKTGRSVSIHKNEPFLIELRTRQKTKEGRDELRERVGVEHALARVGQTQGRRARYKGVRKNLMPGIVGFTLRNMLEEEGRASLHDQSSNRHRRSFDR